jgi:hypothetical protein
MTLPADGDSAPLLIDFPDGSCLLIVATESIVLNSTARFIWKQYIESVPPIEIAKLLARQYRIEFDRALNDVHLTIRLDLLERRPAPYHGPYEMVATENGFRFSHNGIDFLDVDADARVVRIFEQTKSAFSLGSLEAGLFSLAPNFMALRGKYLLHGAAVELASGDALLLIGHSGAGKTTTAALLARAQRLPLLSEDKLLMSRDVVSGKWRVATGFEAFLRDWAQRTSSCLVAAGSCSLSGLDRFDLSALAVRRIWEVDKTRRVEGPESATLSSRTLSLAESSACLLGQTFRGSNSIVDLASFSNELGSQAPIEELSVPGKLNDLEKTLIHYSLKT